MKQLIYPAIIIMAICSSAFTIAYDSNPWKVKEESYLVKFTSKEFDGTFKGLKTELFFDENNLENSRLTATIDANTINTGNGMRNGHAKKGLDAQTFPTVKFVSKSFTKTNVGYLTTGQLTIKDVTREINIPFTFTRTSDGGVFAGNFTIIPAEFNVTKSGTPKVLDFELNVPVTK